MLVGNRLMKLYGEITYNPKIYVGDFCLGDTESSSLAMTAWWC